MPVPVRNSACKDNELACVTCGNRKLLESEQRLLAQSWVWGWKWGHKLPGCWVPRSPGLWSLVSFLVESSRKHSNDIVLPLLLPSPEAWSWSRKFPVFLFEQMQTRVANVGTRISSCCRVLCDEAFQPSLTATCILILMNKSCFCGNLTGTISSSAPLTCPQPALPAHTQPYAAHQVPTARISFIESIYMVMESFKGCRLGEDALFYHHADNPLKYNPGNDSLTICWTVSNRLSYPSNQSKCHSLEETQMWGLCSIR